MLRPEPKKSHNRRKQVNKRQEQREFLGKTGPLRMTHKKILKKLLNPAMPKIIRLFEQKKFQDAQLLIIPVTVKIAAKYALAALALKRNSKNKRAFGILEEKMALATRRESNLVFSDKDEKAILSMCNGNEGVLNEFIFRFARNHNYLLRIANETIMEKIRELG